VRDDHRIDVYGRSYDPRPAIEAWRDGHAEAAIRELWERLYHQGDVNTASYAAVGEIVCLMRQQAEPEWNAYALIASIEEGRLANGAPPVPADLENGYRAAWSHALMIALRHLESATDDLVVRSALAVVAHAKGQHILGAIALYTEDERIEMLDK